MSSPPPPPSGPPSSSGARKRASSEAAAAADGGGGGDGDDDDDVVVVFDGTATAATATATTSAAASRKPSSFRVSEWMEGRRQRKRQRREQQQQQQQQQAQQQQQQPVAGRRQRRLGSVLSSFRVGVGGNNNRRRPPPERLGWPAAIAASAGAGAPSTKTSNSKTGNDANGNGRENRPSVSFASGTAATAGPTGGVLPPPPPPPPSAGTAATTLASSNATTTVVKKRAAAAAAAARRVTIQRRTTTTPRTNRSDGAGAVDRIGASAASASRPPPPLWIEKHAPASTKDLCVAPKKVKDVVDFLTSGTGSPKLLILVGSPGVGKSTAVRVAAEELGVRVQEWEEALYSYDANAGGGSGSGGSGLEQLSPAASFERFLQQAGVGYSSLSLQSSTATTASPSPSRESKSVILLEELPHRHDEASIRSFRDLLTRHVLQTSVKTVLIWSHVCEGQHRPEQLEQLLDRSVLYSPSSTQIMQIHPPTKSRMKRVVETILQKERRGGGTAKRSSKKKSGNHDSFYEDLYTRCNGDLRFAITTLQMERSGSGTDPRTSSNATSDSASIAGTGGSSRGRDTKLTTFHALGKILYAKRKEDRTALENSFLTTKTASQRWDNGGRPPLNFNPERVLEYSDLTLSGGLYFLQSNCLDFFTDEFELCDALERFSDAAYLLDRARDGGSFSRDSGTHGATVSSAFPDGYVASLASRSVACFNRHPAPGKFRQFTAPKIFEILRKRDANRDALRHISNHLTMSSSDYNATLSLSCYVGDASQFATDALPYVRQILPRVGEASLEQLHSHIRATFLDRNSQQLQSEEEMMAMIEEQTEILKSDDIEDFSSASDNDDDRDTTSGVQRSGPKNDDATTSESPISTVDSLSVGPTSK